MLLKTMSRWDTMSKGEEEDFINKLQKRAHIKYISYMVLFFAFSFPTIYFAPVGKKDDPIRYQVTQLDEF